MCYIIQELPRLIQLLPSVHNVCCPSQDRLVWYCGRIWSREEDQSTQCPVSHCQHGCPTGSHAQDQVLAHPKYDLILFCAHVSVLGFVFAFTLVLFFSYRLARASQTYLFPIHLTDQLLPSAVFYATAGPLLVYMVVHRLIIIPYTQAQKEQ